MTTVKVRMKVIWHFAVGKGFEKAAAGCVLSLEAGCAFHRERCRKKRISL